MRSFFVRLAAYVALSLALALAVPVWFQADRVWQYPSSPQPESQQSGLSGEPVLKGVPRLRTARLVLGGALLLAGFWLLRGQYRPRPGFAVTPGWAAVFGDLVFVLAGTTGAYGLCYYLLGRWWGVEALVDEVGLGALAMLYLPGLAVLAGFASQWSGQSLEVGERGLTRHGPGGSCFLPWEQVQGFGLEETVLPIIRGGVALPRHFQAKLVIKTAEGEVSLFEPGRAATKQELVAALRRLAPSRLQDDIARLVKEW